MYTTESEDRKSKMKVITEIILLIVLLVITISLIPPTCSKYNALELERQIDQLKAGELAVEDIRIQPTSDNIRGLYSINATIDGDPINGSLYFPNDQIVVKILDINGQDVTGIAQYSRNGAQVEYDRISGPEFLFPKEGDIIQLKGNEENPGNAKKKNEDRMTTQWYLFKAYEDYLNNLKDSPTYEILGIDVNFGSLFVGLWSLLLGIMAIVVIPLSIIKMCADITSIFK